MRLPVGAKYRMSLDDDSKFVPPNLEAGRVGPGRRGIIKLPMIMDIRQKLLKQQQETENEGANQSFITGVDLQTKNTAIRHITEETPGGNEIDLEDSDEDTFMKRYEKREKKNDDESSLEESIKPVKKLSLRDASLSPEEMLMSQAIIKKKEWAKRFRISPAKIYELFSEFSSMVLVAKIERMNKAEVSSAPDEKSAYEAKMRRLFPNSDLKNH